MGGNNTVAVEEHQTQIYTGKISGSHRIIGSDGTQAETIVIGNSIVNKTHNDISLNAVL